MPEAPSDLRVLHVMNRDVFVLSIGDSVSDAIAAFEEYGISGAPVTDESGELVGVLSLTDIARSSHVHDGLLETERAEFYFLDPLEDESSSFVRELAERSDYSPEVVGRTSVEQWMSPRILSVPPDATLTEACRRMTAESVHRVLVIGDEGLEGIVTSFDVVRAIAGAL